MLRLGIQTLAHMGVGVAEGPQRIRMGLVGDMQPTQCLVVVLAVGMVPMEQQGGTTSLRAGQAGVQPLAPVRLHIHQPLIGLPGRHSGAEVSFAVLCDRVCCVPLLVSRLVVACCPYYI